MRMTDCSVSGEMAMMTMVDEKLPWCFGRNDPGV